MNNYYYFGTYLHGPLTKREKLEILTEYVEDVNEFGIEDTEEYIAVLAEMEKLTSASKRKRKCKQVPWYEVSYGVPLEKILERDGFVTGIRL